MIHQAIQSQYLATLAMFQQAVENCPASLWSDDAPQNPFWQIAYHALFYTYLYLYPCEADFEPWPQQQADAHFMGALPYPPHTKKQIEKPYSQDEIVDFLNFCRERIPGLVKQIDIHAPSGFDWIQLNKLELQFYNIRHLQQHVGELCDRLFEGAGVNVDWIGRVQAT
jgi:hypothetical protein